MGKEQVLGMMHANCLAPVAVVAQGQQTRATAMVHPPASLAYATP